MAKAQTRRKKDKDMIDAFIVESVGFEAVDTTLTKLAIDGAQAIRERALSTMRIIRLSNCALDASCVPSICELLKGAKTLQACDLRGNPFDEASATAIASAALERSVSLCGFTKKDRSNMANHPGGENPEFFPKTDCSGVDCIFAISDCRVAATGLKTPSASAQPPPPSDTRATSRRVCGFMTCTQLILKDKPKLTNLWFSLQGAGVGDLCAAQLAKLITEEPRLGWIRACDNKITMAGAQLLADAYSANTNLKVEIDITEGPWDEPQRLIDEAGCRGVHYDGPCDDKGRPIATAPIRAVKKALEPRN